MYIYLFISVYVRRRKPFTCILIVFVKTSLAKQANVEQTNEPIECKGKVASMLMHFFNIC